MDEIAKTDTKSRAQIPKPLRRQIRSWIIEGLRNRDIRLRLEQAGFHEPVSDMRLTHYRQDPRVREAEGGLTTEAMQVGRARRSLRIMELDEMAKSLYERMMGIIPGEPNMPRVPPNLLQFAMACRCYLEIVRHIEELTKAALMQQMATVLPAAEVGQAAPDRQAFLLAMFNDALEEYLERKEQAAQAQESAQDLPMIEAGHADGG